MTLSKDDILQVEDRQTERKYVPQWGDEVILSTFSALDSDNLTDSMLKRDNEGNVKTDKKGNVLMDNRGFRARVVALSLCNEDGSQMFTFKEADKLGRKNPKVIHEELYPVVARLNGLAREAEKNSEIALTDNSSSA